MKSTKEKPEASPQIPLSETKASLALKVKEKFLCIITGLPGAGKSFITRSIKGNPKPWLIAEDYGEDRGGKYMLKIPSERMLEAWIITGTADNFFESVSEMLTQKLASDRPPKGVALYYVMPDPKVFKESNALKAAADTPFSKHFLSFSKLSEKAVSSQATRQLELWVKKLGAVASSHDLMFEHFQVPNTWDGTPITRGWDEVKASKEQEGGDDNAK